MVSTKQVVKKMENYKCEIRATTLTFSSAFPISIGHMVTRVGDNANLYLVRLGCHNKVDPTQPCGLPVLVRVGFVYIGAHEGEDPNLLDMKVGELYHIGEYVVVGGLYLENVYSQIPKFSEFGQLKGRIYLILTFSMIPKYDCGGTHTIRSIIERTIYQYDK
jgi:hypothetical protein